jgi:cell division protein FtsB
MSMFPQLVEPIREQLASSEAELDQLKQSVKAKKAEIRLLRSTLSKWNGEANAKKPRQPKAVKS